MAILKNTNFFRDFTASSTILAIYIQQLWDTMCFNSSTELYSFQLDEQWFNLHKDILRDALDITPTNDNNPFVAPPSSDTVIEYINTMGYPRSLRNVSAISVNALYEPRRAILSMINISNIDYAERIWEEFVQSIQTFLTDRKNLAMASRGKKKTTHLLIPSIRFTKLIIHHLKTKHNIHPRSGLPLHYSHDESVLNTLRYVKKKGREIFGMPISDALAVDGGATESSKDTKVTKPKAAKATKPASDPKPKPAPTQPPKAVPEKKQKVVQETPDEPSPAKRSKGGRVRKIRKPMSSLKLVNEPSAKDVPVEEPTYNEEEAILQRDLKLSLKEQEEHTQGPACPVVIQEPDSGRIQPLRETSKNKSHVDQFIFQRCTPMPAKASGPAESPSLDAELALTDKNLKLPSEDLVIPEEPTSSTGTLSSLQNLEKELSFTDQFFVEKQWEEEPGKTNAKVEVQSMVLVPIHQDTSSVPPMTTPVIDLTMSQSGCPLPTSSSTTSTVMTTTTIPPPPPQPQQSTADPTLMKRIDKLEQHTSNLLQYNLALEERLDKHGSRLYKLENLNILCQVSKEIDEIVTDVVDCTMQALLRAHFSDLSAVDMKEILQQWMFEDKSYEAREDHKNLYDALENLLEHDYSDQILSDLEEARQKKRKRRDVPRTPFGSPPPYPPPPSPPAGASGAPGSKALSSSKSTASALQSMAWTKFDTRYESAGLYGTQELSPIDSLIPDDSIPDERMTLISSSRWRSVISCLQDQVDWTNPKGDQVRIDVNRPLRLGGPLGHVTIQSQFFFNKELEYLRHGSKESSPVLLISKMKAASYPDFGLELLVPEQISSILTDMILHCIVKKSDHTCEFSMLSKLKPTQDTGYEFKHDYTIIESPRAIIFPVNNNKRKIMRFNEIHKFSDDTLTWILEALAYRVKEFKIKQLNPSMNTRFWTQKDMTKSKEFISAIERRLKTRRIYQNLECFVGG
nr:hypothetical protein [Tanacetum cinerariifolium]